jgi:hypothetical protein
MPTAVITESKLNTMSIRMIWSTTLSMLVAFAVLALPSRFLCSTLAWISTVAFQIRNSPPMISTRSRPLIGWSRDVKERVLHTHDEADAEEQHQTRDHGQPKTHALRLALASFPFSSPLRMLMTMMLSMPSTISNAVSVSRRRCLRW